MTAIHTSIIYGPVASRRLGRSLGVNLLPADGKICTFDCVYCECGLNRQRHPTHSFPSASAVLQQLEQALDLFIDQHYPSLDTITFAGNGEPTLHPHFLDIITSTIQLRDLLAPSVRIAVLSNASTLHLPHVVDALLLVDDPILKLDSALDPQIILLNAPQSPHFNFSTLLTQLKPFTHKAIIQTIFFEGAAGATTLSNTAPHQIQAWIHALQLIQPKQVMIYTLDRDTPLSGLKKISPQRLQLIAAQVKDAGFNVLVAP